MCARARERDTFTIIPCSTVSAQSHPESKPEEQAADMDLADIDDEEIDKAWFSSLEHLSLPDESPAQAEMLCASLRYNFD